MSSSRRTPTPFLLASLSIFGLLSACEPEHETTESQSEAESWEFTPPDADDAEVTLRAATTSVVSPILLIPAGSTVTPAQELVLRQALSNVRRWYQRELPNRDIRWENLRILAGASTAAQYLVDNRVWADMPGEIQSAFGWNPWDASASNHVALVIGRDLLGWAGGAGYPEGRGLAIVGMESLVDNAKCAGEWWCTQEFWHGTAIHELGHGLTLPHDTDPTSIMNFHGEYKSKHLTATAKSAVEALPCTGSKVPYPLARWTFDTCPTTVPDEALSATPLGLANGASCSPGLIQNSGTFDGIDDVATTAPEALSISNQLTISAWVKPTRVTGASTIVNKWYSKDSYALFVRDGHYEFSIAVPGGTWGVPHTIRTPATVNAWADIAGVYDGSQMRLYVNGQLKASKNVTGSLQTSTRPVSVGSHPSWNPLQGQVDLIEIYDKALTRDQIFAY